jgi:hypothetical protein
MEGVNWLEHLGLAARVVKSIPGFEETSVDERVHKGHVYAVFKGPANFDEFVQQAATAGTVLRTVPERRVVILQVNPARFPGP